MKVQEGGPSMSYEDWKVLTMRATAIQKCAETNFRYMGKTPAGQAGYPAVVRLYDRLATQSYDCARAWLSCRDLRALEHEPAVDAFWWGVVEWAHAFPRALLRWSGYHDPELYDEMELVFFTPHREFARWLRPKVAKARRGRVLHWRRGRVLHWRPWPFYQRPAEIILQYDAHWTRRVILLTARWGLLHHLRDVKALWQALFLMRRLRSWPEPVAAAYLASDLVFLRELFGHFDFSPRLKAIIENFLAVAESEVRATK